jgi:cytochrome c peroxidase
MKRLILTLALFVLCSAAQELPVAIVTHAPIAGGWEANAPLLEASVREAAKGRANFVVLPELAWTGSLKQYTDAARLPSEPVPGPATNHWGAVSKELGIWLLVSLVEKNTPDDPPTIALVLLDPRGDIVAVRHKVLARLGMEDGAIARGSFREIQDSVDVGGARIGILSGDDLRVGVPRLAIRGADVILVASGWTKSDPTDWAELCGQLARENSVSLVVTSREPSAAFNGAYSPEHQPTSENQAWTIFRIPARNKKWQVMSALGLPSTVPAPARAPGSELIAALGRRLFFDRNLSSTGKVACASCHQPEHSFTNRKPKGEGVFGRTTKRNVPSLLNVAFRPLLQWDGYASTLENFAKYPMSGVSEMNFHYLDRVGAYLESQPSYVRDFRAAMGITKIAFDDVAYALATYQRTLISAASPFDLYYYGSRTGALTPEAARGLALFTGKANCSSCHTIGRDYALFLDFEFHATGVGYNRATRSFEDIGLGGISTDDQAGLFQTPPLRNVAETPPYMHDGSLPTLEAVIEFYNQGGIPNPKLDPRIRPLDLSDQEKSDLLAFLKSLTGAQKYEAPKQPRLSAGGIRGAR